MTEIEKEMRAFNASQKPCKHSNKRPKLQWTGIHVIACGVDCKCAMHDGNDPTPKTIIRAWNLMNQ